MVLALVVLGAGQSGARGEEPWPPAPPLKPTITAADMAPLPSSVSAAPSEKGEWRCTFHFRPTTPAQRVQVTGSYNGWDRLVDPMKGPDASGAWVGQVDLPAGVYEYKFLIDNEKWLDDPANSDRVPDGFGGHNSLVRLGRLAGMKASPAKVGDGEIDPVGLAHLIPLPLYVQPDGNDLTVRYRTLAHDVEHVSVAVRNGATTEMKLVCEGPLFAYWEARIAVPQRANNHTSDVRSVEYTFVLQDGATRASDPYTPYRYTFGAPSTFTTPEWARNAVWYQILLDRFRNGDQANDPDPVRPWTSDWYEASPWEGKDGQTFYKYFAFDRSYGGDLAGLEAELPYLKELGVNALYLNPVFKSKSYHKYDVQNHQHVDDHFGTKGDYDAVAAKENLLDPTTWQWTPTDRQFLEFLKKAHDAGFKVIIDGVFNHVGIDHPAFQDVVAKGRESRFADWFDVLSWEPFRYNGWAGFQYMPVLRKTRDGFASASYKQYVFNVIKRWMDPNGDGDPRDGVDGWRLDVPNDIPRPFWVEFRQQVKKINPDAFITAEIWSRADEYLDGYHFDAVTNYEFAKTAVKWMFDTQTKITAADAASRLTELRLAYPAAATHALQSLVDSHDTDRLASMAQNPDREFDRQNRLQDEGTKYDDSKPRPESYQKARLAVLLQMTYVGAPMIYYGDEVGMWGADDPNCRKPMLWKDLQPYAKPEENAVMEDQLAFYKQVIALHNAHPALRDGTFQSLLADDQGDVWAFLRSDAGEQIIVALNRSNAPRDVQIPLTTGAPPCWTPIFRDAGQVTVVDGKLKLRVPAVSGVVLQASAK